MKKSRVYLDSCILISFFSKLEKEKKNKKTVEKILSKLGEFRMIETCISPLVITETINILLNEHKMNNQEVLGMESGLINKKRLGDLKIKILKAKKESQKDYDFEEFLYEIREATLKYHPGFADAMHIVIMKNNGVEFIMTFNPKDFEGVEGLTVVDLDNFLSAKPYNESDKKGN